MDCKNCIHEKVCVIITFSEAFENIKWVKEPCDHFKNKEEFEKVIAERDKAVELIKYLDFPWCEYLKEGGVSN